MNLAELPNCTDLSLEHAVEAARSAGHMRTLLARAAEIARPGEGCPKVLQAIARLADEDCTWVEGEVQAVLTGDDETTTLTVFCDHGFGIREKLLPVFTFAVPLDEFVRAVRLAPAMVAPLLAREAPGKLVLGRDIQLPSAPPPPSFELEDESVAEQERRTAPPHAPVDETTAAAALANVHTRPTVRRMPAIDLEALRSRGDTAPGRREDEGDG